MRKTIAKLAGWILCGAGFGIGFFLIATLYDRMIWGAGVDLDDAPLTPAATPIRYADHGLVLTNAYVRADNIGIVSLGTIANLGTSTWSWVSIRTEVFDSGNRLLDQWDMCLPELLQPGERQHFKDSSRLQTEAGGTVEVAFHEIRILSARQEDSQ
jgi:hypothetical protein